jgi:catalase
LYRNAMSEQDRKNLVSNIVNSMNGICGEKKDEIINRQLSHFFRADSQLGKAVAKGLEVNL